MDGLQQIAVMFVVMAAFGVVLWILQRRGVISFRGAGLRVGLRAGRTARAERKLEIVERLQLTPHHAICLVRVENATLLIGTAPSSCTLLSGPAAVAVMPSHREVSA